MKVLIISGYLGAGKTTFIRHMTELLPEQRFAVLENEFGQTDVDAKMIRSTGDIKVWELTENCVCCSGKSDFLSTLLTIANAVNPEILVVEPTGIARLKNMIANIEGLHYSHIRMLKPLVIIDINGCSRERLESDEIYLDQVKNAGTVVISKIEGMCREELEPYERLLREWNPDAEIAAEDYKRREADWFRGLLKNTVSGNEADSEEDMPELYRKEKPVETVTYRNITLPSLLQLMILLDIIAGRLLGRIQRAKGYLPCGKEWIRFDLVEQQWQVTGYEPQEESVMTFIGTDLMVEDLERYLYGRPAEGKKQKQPKISAGR